MRSFTQDELRALCEVLGDTREGLTNSELDLVFDGIGVDPYPSNAYSKDFIISIISKKERLFEALRQVQSRTNSPQKVIEFIQAAMNPVRYVQDRQHFTALSERLNGVLSFAGLQITKEGKIATVPAVSTLEEAQERANTFRANLGKRAIHNDLLVYCKAELLQENYFHAVFEATKSVADKIRIRTGLDADGAELVDRAFGFTKGLPLLGFNTLRTRTEKDEHQGIMNLLKGMFGTFRNVTAHVPKVRWTISEPDALDLFSLASFLHRRIDRAIPSRSQERV
jgi:uncharacterized protein (TIGR02391 family)